MTYLLILFAMLSSPGDTPDFHALTRHVPSNDRTQSYQTSDEEHNYDAVHYTVNLEVLPEEEKLEGYAGIKLTSSGPDITDVRFDLIQLEVDSVWDASGVLEWEQIEDSVFVTLSETISLGDTTTVYISYGGIPWNEGGGGFGGFWFHPYVYYHMGVGVYTDPPSLGRCIFPCWDHPSDKASIEFYLTVPNTLYAIANGDMAWMQDNQDGTVLFHWVQPQPMSTYLAAFAVSDYEVLTDSTYDWIKYYVYPWDIEDALVSFRNVDLMMDRYEEVFIEYPWDTKFSYVQTPKGDMEHLTQVYHIASAINGYNNYDWLLAHEMSHHWWGDCVTELEWSDVWLSEGFAVYCEAVWAEYYGQESYDDYMLNIMKRYLQSGELFPLTEPTTPAEMWSYTTYQKGASILHMLRYVLGDDIFYESLMEYFDHHSYASATTDDLRDHFENVSGEDIDWFFDTWIWDWGYPVYDISYSWVQSGSDWTVSIEVEQIQTVGPIFTMPLEFLVSGASDDTLLVMWNDAQTQSENFTVSFEPTSVEFDPDNNILSPHLTGISEQPSPPPFGTGTLHFLPNPAPSFSTEIFWRGMENSDITVRIFDLTGRMLQEIDLTGDERTLDLQGIPEGLYLVEASAPGNLRQTAKLIRGRT